MQEDSRHFKFGTAIHSALENLYLQYDDNFGGAWEAASEEDYIDKFKDNWKLSDIGDDEFERFLKTKKGQECGFKKKEELYQYMKADGITMLKEYWKNKEWLLTEHGADFESTEEYMRVPLFNPINENDALPIPMSLRIDAIKRNRGDIADFKTSGGKYNEKEAREKIQGQCYSYALFTEDRKVRNVDYIVLIKDRKTEGRIQVVHLKYDINDLAAWYERVKSILQRIANNEFAAPSVGHSPWCDCKKFDELLDVSKIKHA